MILSPQHQNRIRNLGMSAVYRIAADEGVPPSTVLDLMVTAPFTPSQPGTSQPHAPAAQMDGEAVASQPSSPSVDLSGLAAHEQGPQERSIGPRSAESPRFESVHGSREDHRPATYGQLVTAGETASLHPSPAVPPAGDAADGQAETLLSEPSVATKEPVGKALMVIKCHEEHPDWPAKVIAKHLGLSRGSVSAHASLYGVSLPSQRDYDEAQKAKTTEALKAPPAKPQEAVETPPAPKAQPEPEQRPASMPVDRALPLPPPAVKPMQKGPQGRFYLKEKTEIGMPSRWVHQSLQPCPTGPGPLMTLDRKWAWYDTMERFKGAVKKWPELKEMQKVRAAS